MHSSTLSILLAPLAVSAAALAHGNPHGGPPGHGPAAAPSSTISQAPAATNVCQSPPYAPLLGLAGAPVAEAYCQKHFPQNIATTVTTVTYSGVPTPSPAAHGPKGLGGLHGKGKGGDANSNGKAKGHGAMNPGAGASHGKGQSNRLGHDKRDNKNWQGALARGEAFISTLCSCIETPMTTTLTSTVYPTSSSASSSSSSAVRATTTPVFPVSNSTMTSMTFSKTAAPSFPSSITGADGRVTVFVPEPYTVTVTATVTAQ